MKILTKAVLTLSLALPLSFTSVGVFAAEAAPATASVSTSSAIISHIEKALVEVSKSDFSAAQVHLKAARNKSDTLAGNSDAAKKAHAVLLQGQIASKSGNVSDATEELNKAIELYKAL